MWNARHTKFLLLYLSSFPELKIKQNPPFSVRCAERTAPISRLLSSRQSLGWLKIWKPAFVCPALPHPHASCTCGLLFSGDAGPMADRKGSRPRPFLQGAILLSHSHAWDSPSTWFYRKQIKAIHLPSYAAALPWTNTQLQKAKHERLASKEANGGLQVDSRGYTSLS